MSVFRNIPLTLKMMTITLLIGIAAWSLLDPVHRRVMKNSFGKQLNERLQQDSHENRMLFDDYITRYMQSTKILISQRAFQDYAEAHAKAWAASPAGKDRIIYHSQPPGWMPTSSVIRSLPHMHYVFLLDKGKSIREVYLKEPASPPGELLEPASLLLLLSHQQAFMTAVDDKPYLVASETLSDSEGNEVATLLLADPLDDVFIRESLGAIYSKKLVALVGMDPRVIIESSHPDILPPGTELSALDGRYLYSGKGFFDYGSSDLRMNFITFLPTRPYEDLSESILKDERMNRMVTAVILILSLSFLMYWITKRVQLVTDKVRDFAEKELKMKQPQVRRGDEIYVLEQRFHALSREVLASHASIKEQALMLRHERDRAQNYLDTAASIFLVTGPDHTVVLINRRGCEILEYGEEELIGRDWFETVMPAGSREDAKANFQEFMADKIGSDLYLESPVLTKKGEQRIIGWHNTLLKDESGSIIGVLGSGEDVTDRRKAEEELWQAHQMLETKVKERTAELEKTNLLLNEEIAQRMLTEHNLRESEKKLEKAQAIAKVGSWDWDIQSNQVLWSDEVYRIYGYQPGEIEPDYEVVKKAMHPDSTKVFLEAIDSALSGERPLDMEYTFFRRDGKERVLHTKGEVIRDGAGRPVKMFGVVQDITERRQAEVALKESERRFRETLTTINMIAIQLDINGDILFANDFLSRLSGWKMNEIVGKNWMDIFVSPADRDHIRALHHKNCLSGNITEYYNNKILLKNGQSRLISWSNSRLMDPTGNVIGITSIGADITEQKKTEKELMISEERFRGAFESAAIGIGLVSTEGRWLKVNAALCNIVGYSEQELLALTFQDITHPEDLDADLEYVRQMLAGVIRNYHMEKRYFHKEGHVVWIRLSVSLVRDENGAPIHFVSQIQDITKRKQAEMQVAASLKEKEVLLQEIHHRVKNNMTVISSLLKLQADKVTDKYYKELFIESTNRIKTMALIHEKLYRSEDLARIVFSDYLKDMIDNIVGSYGINAGTVSFNKDLERIILPLDTSIPCGLIVNELLSNSLKYAFPDGRSGEIMVSLRKNNGTVELTVGDDGIGLPTDLDFRNTGSLGLNIVNALVKQIRGHIELHQEQGTEFHITFRSDTE